jgi:hypothetical protein
LKNFNIFELCHVSRKTKKKEKKKIINKISPPRAEFLLPGMYTQETIEIQKSKTPGTGGR